MQMRFMLMAFAMFVMFPVAVMVSIMRVMPVMVVRMTVRPRSTEQTPYLMRSQIGYYLIARTEFVADILYMVSAHDAVHDLAIDSQRHIHRSSLDHRRPMLVAYGVSQLDGDVYDGFGILLCQASEVDDHYVIEAYSYGRYSALLRIILYDVAIRELRSAFECHGIFVVSVADSHETTLLRRPLIEFHILHVAIGNALLPLRRREISYDSGIYLHLVCTTY